MIGREVISVARHEKGFSLVEVIMAMFLLSVLALAILPLLIGATRVSVSNRDLVAATAFANAQLAPITAAFPNDPSSPTSCAALKSGWDRDSIADAAGTGLVANVSVGGCPPAFPGTVTLTVSVSRDGERLVVLPSRVLVSSS
jgi:prepilin-type N-terminal cleavage/methylation domain-containing protein